MIRTLANAILSITLAILVSFEAHRVVLSMTPPMYYTDAHTLDPITRIGGTIRLSYTFNRVRICQSWLSRFIIGKANNQVFWRESVPGVVWGVEATTVVNGFTVPENIPLGDYEFITYTFSNCYEGTHYTAAPRIPFSIR